MTRSRFQLAPLATCIILLAAAPVWAEPAAPGSLAQALNGEAKAAYDSARLLLEDGDYAGGLAKFSRAYEVSHDARLLWNMAVCEKELRHYARAGTLVGRYLKEGGNRISSEQRQNASDTQNALRGFYATVKLSGTPDGATVLVDGAKFGQTPLAAPLLVDLGSRTLRVELPGFEPFETTLAVAGGGELEVPVALEPTPLVSAAPARLSVMTAGIEDIVAIDGKVRGSHRWEGVIAIGEHTVRVTGAHKKPYETHLQLPAGSVRSLQVTLEDEDRRSNVWLWVAGGAAVAAGAAVGGYFLFKPDDTPGSHPVGKLSTVYLSLGTSAR